MSVTNIRVLFSRKKQPAQYEEANPLIEFNAVIEPGQNHRAIAAGLMLDAAELVYTTLGNKEAVARIRTELGAIADESDDEAEVVTASGELASADQGNATARRKRRTKAEIEAAKAAEASQTAGAVATQPSTSEAPTAPAATVTASPAPVQTTAAPSAPVETQAPVQTAAPTPAPSSTPTVAATAAPASTSAPSFTAGLDEAGIQIVTVQSVMQKWVSDNINARKLTVEQYRGILAEVSGGKAVKTTDLSDDQRRQTYDKVKAILDAAAPAPAKTDAIDI